MSGEALRAATEKMRADGQPDEAVRTFARAYEALRAGASGTLPDRDIEPVRDVIALADLPARDPAAALDRVAVIKLNGGLGTSMGMSRAKSLIEAREGLSFLDVIARQTLALRARHGIRLPLVLMNSYRTRDDSLAALARYPDLPADVPLDFLQHREPRVRADDLTPVRWPDDPELEWAPPGHGDLYPALRSSGMLAVLLDRGYTHAFVSNADNLGAVLEPRLLAWLAAEGVPFAMEVVTGTEADRKGGHIARRLADGRLVLRETAQADDPASFRDYRRWRHYNTNNLWIDLRALAALLDAGEGTIDLPLIVNRKRVAGDDPAGPEVIQLESAMGAAIGAFDGARAIGVPRTRFAPVKTTDDLLVLRSDVYRLTGDARVERSPEGAGDEPFVALDPAYFAALDAFDARFPHGPPSLVRCDRLVVRGDVTFGARVVARGDVEVVAGGGGLTIPDGAVLSGVVSGPPMTAPGATAGNEERARDIFRRLFDERDLTDPGWYWADGITTHFYALDLAVHGADGMADFFTSLFAAVPDWSMEVEEVRAHEDGATIRWRGRGTFTGAPWMGIEPTGTTIDLPGCDVMRFDAEGRVTENRVYYDGATFARAAGMLPRRDSAADRAMLAAFNAATKAKRRMRRG